MSGELSGPGALAGAAEAGIEYSARQFDTVSHTPQQSLSRERLRALSRAFRRLKRQSDRDGARRFIKVVRTQNVGHCIIRQVSNETVASMETLLFPLRCEGAIQ